jgi:hypothetical protein
MSEDGGGSVADLTHALEGISFPAQKAGRKPIASSMLGPRRAREVLDSIEAMPV